MRAKLWSRERGMAGEEGRVVPWDTVAPTPPLVRVWLHHLLALGPSPDHCFLTVSDDWLS